MVIIIGIAMFISVTVSICLGGANIGKDELEIGYWLEKENNERQN